MRQGQQNRRGRGRNNHNHNHNQHRKGGHNPLTRSFESTGPDTKIRGTPAHIAEKYMALARDALSSGDPVLAENYLQHAEHYNRIIMTYREQTQQPGDFSNGNGQPQGGRFQSNDPRDGDDFGDEGDDFGGDQPVIAQQSEQPQIQQPPRSFEGQRHEDRGDRGDRGPGQGHEGQRNSRPHQNNRERFGGDQRNFNQDRSDRQDRGERRERFDRNDRGDRSERFDRQDRPDRQPSADSQAALQRRPPPPDRDRIAPTPGEQPEFLRRPVRRPRQEGAASEAAPAGAPPSDDTNRD